MQEHQMVEEQLWIYLDLPWIWVLGCGNVTLNTEKFINYNYVLLRPPYKITFSLSV